MQRRPNTSAKSVSSRRTDRTERSDVSGVALRRSQKPTMRATVDRPHTALSDKVSVDEWRGIGYAPPPDHHRASKRRGKDEDKDEVRQVAPIPRGERMRGCGHTS